MNRIGINLWNWNNAPSEDYIKWMERAADMGFGAVELPMTDLESVRWDQVRDFARNRQLEITLCASLPAGRDISSFDAQERENARAYLLKCCDIGGCLGAKVLAGPIYSGGGKRHWLQADDRKREWDYAVQGLREISAEAEKNGLKLGIEPINRYRTSMVNTVEQGLQMAEDIAMANVGLLFDTYQANIEETDPALALSRAVGLGKLAHFHACENNREAPGRGHIDWKGLTQVLVSGGYTGHCTMELFCKGGLDASWQCSEDRDEEARRGLDCLASFLKQTI